MTIENYNSKEKVYEFLKEHAVAVLSTVGSDGTPSASPIYFIVDKELNFYFITYSDTEKSQNIEKSNNHAAITIVAPSIPFTVQAKGEVTEIQDPEYLTQLSEANAAEKGGAHWPPPLSKLETEGFHIIYKFQPTWLRVADFSESSGGSSKPGTSLFHQII